MGSKPVLRLSVIVGILAACLNPFIPSSADGNCPDPRTCDHYAFLYSDAAHWPISSDGIAHIPYLINPTQPWIPPETAVTAIQTATRTWEDWNPSIRFEFQGATIRPPVPADGLNVIGWSDVLTRSVIQARRDGPPSAHIIEFDIELAMLIPHTWDACQQADDSCNDAVHGWADVQNMVTHELGHALGLNDLGDHWDCAMTMRGGATAGAYSENSTWCAPNNRAQVTLALGDVLGAKALYPWECPAPDSAGQYPDLYRRICPAIQIFAP